MCDTLSTLRDAFSGYAARFDASLLSAADAAAAVDAAGALERMAAAVKGLAAVRVADAGLWREAGARTAAHQLARTTGTSVGQAADAIETARRLERLPAVSTAARSGVLSVQQASAVADAAAADPTAEGRLVEMATTASLAELPDGCGRTKADAEPDPETRRKAVHDSRYLRSYTGADGAWNLRMRNNPEVGAEIMAAIEPIRDRLFREAHREGRREPSEAYAADALAALCRGGTSAAAGPRRSTAAKIIARVDLAALLRGRPVEGEICELAGFGPVAVSAIRDLLDTGDPFLAAVVTKGEQVVGVAHLGRRANATSRRRSNGSTRRVRSRGAEPSPASRRTIESTGREATPPCSTCSIGSAATITTSRRSTVGGWWTGTGSGRSSLRTT